MGKSEKTKNNIIIYQGYMHIIPEPDEKITNKDKAKKTNKIKSNYIY